MVILLHCHQHHLIQKGKTTPLLVRVKRNIILTFKFLGEAPTSTSQPHQYVTFYVQLSVTRSIAGTVHPVAMTIDTHM